VASIVRAASWTAGSNPATTGDGTEPGRQFTSQTKCHSPNDQEGLSAVILKPHRLSCVYGRPRLSAAKDVKKDVKSVGRAASTEGSQEMRMAYCPPSPTRLLRQAV
jgi:hypothetical protein